MEQTSRLSCGGGCYMVLVVAERTLFVEKRLAGKPAFIIGGYRVFTILCDDIVGRISG